MHFKARYAGHCVKCGKSIEVGQEISWFRKTRGAYHIDCENPAATSFQPEPEASKTSDSATPDALQVLAKAIEPFIATQTVNQQQVQEIIDQALAGFNPVITLEYKRESGEVKQIQGAHANMPMLMYLVSKRHHSYLYGPPGSGKSTAAKQVADCLGLAYGYISLNPQTPDSRLLGYMDATGNYRSTPFQNLYQNGGVFCIDEVDNASPSLLTTLNSGLENGHMAFPQSLVARHKDFVLIATGNTCGKGANPMFPDRRPFDAAFAERFTFVEWGYDTSLEQAITLAINPKAKNWLKWVVGVREFCKDKYPRVLVTPRASFKGAAYLLDSGFSSEQIADMVIFKGLDPATRSAILSANPFIGKGY